MRNIFKLLSKLSLFFIFFGFFEPIACQFNGPALIKEGMSSPINPYLFSLAIILIILLLLPVLALLRLKSKKTETIFTPLLALLLVGIGYFLGSLYNGEYLSIYYFDKGIKTILYSIAASFFFAFINLFIPQKKKESEEVQEDKESIAIDKAEETEEEKPE